MKTLDDLIKYEAKFKIGDLGLHFLVNNATEEGKGMRGTPYYYAPEIKEGIYGMPSDIWAFGVILFHLKTH